MPEEIKISKIIFDGLDAVTGVLKDLGIDYALMGGMALQVWGRIRVTKDIDIVISITDEKKEELLSILRKPPFKIRNAFKKIGDAILIFSTFEDKESGFPINIDIFIAQTPFQKETLKRALEIEVLGRRLKVIRVEDLILYKLLSARPIDRVDAEVLIKENIKDIDKRYLRFWAKDLGIYGKLYNLLKQNA